MAYIIIIIIIIIIIVIIIIISLKKPIDSKYRICSKVQEHIKHTAAGSTKLEPFEYNNRHNKAA